MTNGTGGAVRTRQDVWTLSNADPWHPTLLWYAKAIAQMQTRPVADPTSWRYQAAIHDYTRADDPYASASDVLPSAADQSRFWAQCQHFSWFFLPWHRMYLGCFEQIVLAAVVALGGPGDWALPYWNYSDSNDANAAVLPPAFRAASLPDGSSNPLFVQARDANINGGAPLDPSSVDIGCLKDGVFTGAFSGASPGFGGPKTVFNHDSGRMGGVEKTPHGDVHVNVGGDNGWMSSFDTAALDPIFWLHHANIDRLWEVWRGRDPGDVNPTDADWLNAAGATFPLHDATGAVVNYVPSQVTDTTAAPLGYVYQDISDPLATPAAAAPAAAAAAVSMPMAQPAHPPEVVGASLAPTALAAAPVTEHVAIHPPVSPALRATAVGEPARRTYLNLEHITATGRAPRYGVYLNLPDGAADPHAHQTLFAGTLPMFGVAEASRSKDPHGGGGLSYVLDVTDLVARLKAEGTWDPERLHVTFAPMTPGAASGGVKVGRVSLYYH